MSPKLRRPAESFNLLKNPQATRLGFGGHSMLTLNLKKFKFSHTALSWTPAAFLPLFRHGKARRLGRIVQDGGKIPPNNFS